MNMFIEFAGASCTGKSTLIQALEAELRAEGLDAVAVKAARAETRGDVARAVKDPRLAFWCLLNPYLAARSKRGLRLLSSVGVFHRLRRRDGIVLLDEGPVKLHQTGILRTCRAKPLLVRGLPRPDALVIVSCDPLVRLERLRRTARPHVQAMSDQEILARETGDQFARDFARTREVRTIEVDTSPGSDALGALRDQIGDLVERPADRGRPRAEA